MTVILIRGECHFIDFNTQQLLSYFFYKVNRINLYKQTGSTGARCYVC